MAFRSRGSYTMAEADIRIGLVRQAMAYRVKYRVADGRKNCKKRVPLSLLGVHPLNRGGVYPQPDTVVNLGLHVLDMGFSSQEANHEGVCVQEVPEVSRGRHPLDPTKAYETYRSFNLRCSTSPELKDCFSCESDVMYGTLSHSHLLLTMLSLHNKGRWALPKKFEELASADGTINPDAVADKDPELAKVWAEGLSMEVLSWKIMEEEPMACSLISQALNKGNAIALHTTELTAIAVLTGVVGLLKKTAAVADEVAFEMVREKVRGDLDTFVDLPEFIELFDFVVSLGGSSNVFVPELLDFGSKFVDPKQRQLRLNAFAEANKLPLKTPRTKVAMIMRAYRKPPQRTWCPLPEAAWGKAGVPELEALEAVLHYFQATCKPAVAGMADQRKAALHANVACAAAEAFITVTKVGGHRKALVAATAKFHQEMKTFAESENRQLPTPPLDWMTFTAVAAEATKEAEAAVVAAAAVAAANKRLLPKVISYDFATGAPVTTQDSRSEEEGRDGRDEEIAVPWREWHQSAAAQDLDVNAADAGAVAIILRSMHATGGEVSEAPVQVTWSLAGDGRKGVRLRVRALKALKAGELELPPCVPKGCKAHATSIHPSRVAIRVTMREREEGAKPRDRIPTKSPPEATAAPRARTYYLHPEYKMPEDVTAASGVKPPDPESGSAPSTRLWKWHGDETMHPFWAVQRESGTEMKRRQEAEQETARKPQGSNAAVAVLPRFNTALKEKEFAVVTVGAMGGNSVAMTMEVTIPVLTNTVDVPEGEELFLETTAKEAKGQKRTETWKDHAAVAEKKAKPKPKPTAKASEV